MDKEGLWEVSIKIFRQLDISKRLLFTMLWILATFNTWPVCKLEVQRHFLIAISTLWFPTGQVISLCRYREPMLSDRFPWKCPIKMLKYSTTSWKANSSNAKRGSFGLTWTVLFVYTTQTVNHTITDVWSRYASFCSWWRPLRTYYLSGCAVCNSWSTRRSTHIVSIYSCIATSTCKHSNHHV